MNKKKAMVAVLAIGAVVLAIGAGAVRGALDQRAADQGGEPAWQEQPAEPGQGAASEIGSGSSQGQDPLSELYGAQWEADDGSGALTVMDGVMIEKTGDGEKAVYYRADNVKTTDGGISATLYTSDGKGGAETPAALAVTKGTGSMRLACDALSRDYTAKTGDAAIKIENADGNLESSLGKGGDEVAEAISKWASTKSPYATKAAWSKEVWADYAKGTVVTTFTLDDAAGTIVTVERDASGNLVAS
jgi:hypothetical protein